MKVIILGASGFLGAWVYHKIKNNQLDVVGTQNTSDYSYLIKVDICNESDQDFIIEQRPDVLVWCLMAGSNENKLIHYGLKLLIEKLPEHVRIIYISSDVFSEGKGNYTEEDIPQYFSSANPLSAYANAKIDGERIVKDRKRHIILRIGPIFGRRINGGWDHRTNSLIQALSNNEVYQRADNMYKTFIDVEQLADAIAELINIDYCGVLHLGPSCKESYYTFNLMLAKKLNLDDSLIQPYRIEDVEVIERAIALDTSLNTNRRKLVLKTEFY